MSESNRLLFTEKTGQAIVAHFYGPRITNANDIRSAGDALFRIIEQEKPAELILNLEKVNYLPSSMLGKLAAIRTAVIREGGKLKLAALQSPVKQLFTMTHLDSIFDIYENVDAAIRAT
jgi:anti-anti-sigma factor